MGRAGGGERVPSIWGLGEYTGVARSWAGSILRAVGGERRPSSWGIQYSGVVRGGHLLTRSWAGPIPWLGRWSQKKLLNILFSLSV